MFIKDLQSENKLKVKVNSELKKNYNQVKEFHTKFGHPVREIPTELSKTRAETRYAWMYEELQEFIHANDLVEQVDAMIDLIYFALGTLVEMGVEPDEVFDIVHKANMDKLWPDGKLHHNNDGKTIKPPLWQDPYEIIKESLLKRQ
jgi:predicted HAD superfamily Cof-like phosphohydrolase